MALAYLPLTMPLCTVGVTIVADAERRGTTALLTFALHLPRSSSGSYALLEQSLFHGAIEAKHAWIAVNVDGKKIDGIKLVWVLMDGFFLAMTTTTITRCTNSS